MLVDPFLQMRFEKTNSGSFPNSIRQEVPLSRGSPAVAVLGQGERGIRDNDPGSSVVIGHNSREVFWFLTLSYSKSTDCRVVKYQLVHS